MLGKKRSGSCPPQPHGKLVRKIETRRPVVPNNVEITSAKPTATTFQSKNTEPSDLK
jgi:hypothetical protein